MVMSVCYLSFCELWPRFFTDWAEWRGFSSSKC